MDLNEPMELTNVLHAAMISCKLKGDLKFQRLVWSKMGVARL